MHFDVEDSYDFLHIGWGLQPTRYGSKVKALTGHALPEDHVTSWNETWLAFTSDYSVVYSGFSLILTVEEPYGANSDGELTTSRRSQNISTGGRGGGAKWGSEARWREFWKFLYQDGISLHITCNSSGWVKSSRLDQSFLLSDQRGGGGGGGAGMAPLCPPSYASDFNYTERQKKRSTSSERYSHKKQRKNSIKMTHFGA